MPRIRTALATLGATLALAACVVVPPASPPSPQEPSPTPSASPQTQPTTTPSAAPSPPAAQPETIVAADGGCGPTVVADFVWIPDPAATSMTFSSPSLLDGLSAPCVFTQPIPLDDYEFATESIAFVDGGAASATTIADRLVAMGWVQDDLAASFYDAPDGSAVQVLPFEEWLVILGEDLPHDYEEPARWAYVQFWQAG